MRSVQCNYSSDCFQIIFKICLQKFFNFEFVLHLLFSLLKHKLSADCYYTFQTKTDLGHVKLMEQRL